VGNTPSCDGARLEASGGAVCAEFDGRVREPAEP
jgi:hypothetical protein